MPLCRCGCGAEVSPGKNYIQGHYAKHASKIAKGEIVKGDQVKVSRQDYFSEFGAHGTPILSGISQADYLAKFQTLSTALETYEQMRRSDATCQACLLVMELPICSTKFFVRPASPSSQDKEIADFVEWNLFRGMTHTFSSFLREALGKFWAGFSWFEKVFEPYGSMVKLRKLASRSQATLDHWELDDTGGPSVGWQSAWRPDEKSYQPVPIPIQKLVVFIHRKEAGDLQGTALALDTPIPTPLGWRTMSDLEEGDSVFDEDGQPCKVVATREFEDRPCYKVSFDSAEPIIADENHKWLVSRLRNRSHYKLRTTKQLAERVRYESGSHVHHNWAISVSAPIEYPKKDLTIDPYVLGWWLADGTALRGEISSADDELEGLLLDCGYGLVSKRQSSSSEVTFIYRPEGLETALRKAGLLENKHIPREYLEASVEQRLALLQGLMDGDGCSSTSRNGKYSQWQYQFCNSDKGIVDGFIEIANSLGIKTQSHVVLASKSDIRKKDLYRVYFKTLLPCFRLPRKILNGIDLADRNTRHYIHGVDPVTPRSVKCIQVDSPSGIFLAGRSCVPTHNSVFRSSFKHWLLKDKLYRLEAISLERSAVGIPVITLPRNSSADDKATAKEIVTSLRGDDKAGVTIPDTWGLYLLGGSAPPTRSGASRGASSGGAMTSYQSTIQHHDLMIAKSVLAQFINLPGAAYGSYALSADQSNLLIQMLDFEASEFCDTVSDYVIKQLCSFNWPNLVHHPRLDHSPISSRNIKILSDAWASLASKGLLSLSPNTEEHIRGVIGFPDLETSGDSSEDEVPGEGGNEEESNEESTDTNDTEPNSNSANTEDTNPEREDT